MGYLYLATGARQSGFLLLGICFPVSVYLSPLGLDSFWVSPCLPSLVCLSSCFLAWLWMASGVRSSRCLSSLICFHVFPALASGLSILGGVVWLSGVSLYMSSFMCLPLWLVVSGCPDVFSLLSLGCHHFSWPFFSLSQLMCLQSSVCLTMVVSDSFLVFPCFSQSVSHFICLPIHVSPLVAVSCSCLIAISFVIGPYAVLCSHCVFL